MNRQARRLRRGPGRRRPGRTPQKHCRWVVIAEIHKSAGHPEEGENRVDNREGQSAGTCGGGGEERASPGEFNAGGEIGKRYAQRDVGADILPGGCEVAGNQAQNAEKDRGPAIDIEPEI